MFLQGGTTQQVEAGEAQQLGKSSPGSWAVGLRMGGGNAGFSEAAEEVQNSSTTCVRCSYWSKTSQASAVITGAMDVAHLPQGSHRCSSVICQRKVLLGPWTGCWCPLVKRVLLSSGVLEPLRPGISGKLVRVLLVNSDLPALSKACSWL